MPRHLVLVLGDQLNADSAAFDGFDPACDAVWMAEAAEEATHVPCHKTRLVFFFSAMRHFAEELRGRGLPVLYHRLTDGGGTALADVLRDDVRRDRPERLIVVEPGDWRVRESLNAAAAELGLPLEIRPDRHFYCPTEAFAGWARGRRGLVLEQFYRWMRQREGVLLRDGEPEGGRWNFDADNREAFGRSGPGAVPRAPSFVPDAVTREAAAMVEEHFPHHPGSAARFDLPVTRADARAALDDFLAHRLPGFGRYQDAMWTDEPFLYHSRLSAALNVKLLDPRECVEGAIAAWRAGAAPLASVEGFVRQIVGWREFVRGVYWLTMPEYIERNALGCEDREVPPAFWNGKTEMRCVADAMRGVLDFAYAHHIQRLMVLGLFAQLLGVHPRRFHDWHMAMYADAVDWVSLPNTLGMSQYGDGGVVGTKPYCASGAYIERMGPYCKGCRYDPKQAVGESACPFTTLYWDFLDRHRERLAGNRRMLFQMANLVRKPAAEMAAIRAQAAKTLRRAEEGKL